MRLIIVFIWTKSANVAKKVGIVAFGRYVKGLVVNLLKFVGKQFPRIP